MSKTSYNEAIKELDELIESMTSNEVDIDTVVNDVSRAKDLIQLCQSKLFDVNSKVNEIVDSINPANKKEVESSNDAVIETQTSSTTLDSDVLDISEPDDGESLF